MTPEQIAARVLADVPRHYDANAERVILESDALAALSRHLAPEGDAELIRKLGVIHEWKIGNEAAARLSALTAQVAETQADRDKWFEGAGAHHVASMKQAQRADQAEAEVSRLRARLARMDGAGDDWDALMSDARAEAEKAMRKFPQPNYVISKIAEEAGEVVKAAIHCAEGRETAENLRGEMKQTLAMLYRLWIEGDQVHGLPPVRAALTDGGSNG